MALLISSSCMFSSPSPLQYITPCLTHSAYSEYKLTVSTGTNTRSDSGLTWSEPILGRERSWVSGGSASLKISIGHHRVHCWGEEANATEFRWAQCENGDVSELVGYHKPLPELSVRQIWCGRRGHHHIHHDDPDGYGKTVGLRLGPTTPRATVSAELLTLVT